MKHLLLFCLLLLAASSSAQTYTDQRNGMPRDSTTHKVSFVGVGQVPGATQADLYSAAREWFSTYYKSGKAVLDMDDSRAGKLIGSGYTTFVQKGTLGMGLMQLWATMKVYVKDGRYRYEVTDFAMAPVANPGFKTTLEEPLDSKRTLMSDRDGRPKPILQQVIELSKAEAESAAASLNKAMAAAKPGKGKDW